MCLYVCMGAHVNAGALVVQKGFRYSGAEVTRVPEMPQNCSRNQLLVVCKSYPCF